MEICLLALRSWSLYDNVLKPKLCHVIFKVHCRTVRMYPRVRTARYGEARCSRTGTLH